MSPLPCPDPLQSPLAGRDHRCLGHLALRGPQIHVHERVGRGAAGRQSGQTGVSTGVRVSVNRVAVVGLVAVAVRVRGSDCVRSVKVLRSSQTRPSVPHQHRHGHPPGRRRCVMVMVTRQFQGLVLPLPLTLVPPVLEPDLDLRGGELQGAGEVLPLRRGQVTLLLEAPLQLEHLSLGEEDAGLSTGSLLLHGGFVCVLILTVS